MTYRYITYQDIEAIVDATTLNMLLGGSRATPSARAIEGDPDIVDVVIPAALETIRGYVRHWYDADHETRDSYEYSSTNPYLTGDRVMSNSKYYIAIADAPAGTSISDTDYFEQRDDRNPKLVEICSVIVVYSLFRRINPRLIPEQRQCDLDAAMRVLRDVQAGRIQLDIAEREDVEPSDAGQSVAWGEFDGVMNEIY